MTIRLLLLVLTSLREKAVTREVNDGILLREALTRAQQSYRRKHHSYRREQYRAINTGHDQRLAVRRQQQGNWKTQRSWREDRNRDLEFVWSVGFYFDREEEEQPTGQAGFSLPIIIHFTITNFLIGVVISHKAADESRRNSLVFLGLGLQLKSVVLEVNAQLPYSWYLYLREIRRNPNSRVSWEIELCQFWSCYRSRGVYRGLVLPPTRPLDLYSDWKWAKWIFRDSMPSTSRILNFIKFHERRYHRVIW